MNVFPKKLKIFGEEWHVKVEDYEDYAGYCDNENKILYISPSQNKNRRLRLHTFLHEFFHAVIFRTGIFQGIDEKVIEVICENMATAIIENFILVKRKKK